jgi:hypothetical protein
VILQPRQSPGRLRPRGANREMALGLVLLALVSAFLVNYALAFTCQSRTSWPCRPGAAPPAPATAAVSPTLGSVVVTMPPLVGTTAATAPPAFVPTPLMPYPTVLPTPGFVEPTAPLVGVTPVPQLGPATVALLATGTATATPTVPVVLPLETLGAASTSVTGGAYP